ncbi:MAG TPA: alkaline phosphatase family protein [Vicinamibacterales bacterium]|nr:alkaline phosphatase family protein [Vicinamibacterales bacterium]
MPRPRSTTNPWEPELMRLGRRKFLRGAAAAGGALALGGFGPLESAIAQTALPPPDLSGIDHIVVAMMENRSFDHVLGWLEGADGRQQGLRYTDRSGASHATYRLAPDYQGCGHPDPDHSYQGGRVEFNGGACDGWLRAGDNDAYAIGYYTKKDLSFYAGAAPRWTVCDRYFAAIMAGTFANRIYQHAAQTDRLDNTFEISALPTIWDRLAAAGLDGRYYFSDAPFLALWGARYAPIARPIASFFADAAAGTLPQVSFVEPRFLGEELGVSNDDHPFADVRNGQAFLNRIYAAVTSSPAWARTVLVINYDEWGGFFDHVAPGAAPIPPADQAAGNQDGLRGFRTPCLVVSPFARQEFVSHLELDHTSVLKMIEWRWGLDPLTVRDETANNLAEVLQFGKPIKTGKALSVPTGPFGGACLPAEPPSAEFLPLVEMAADFGFPILTTAR